MAVKIEQRKAELLEGIQSRIQERLAAERARQVGRLAQRMYRLAAPDDLIGKEVDELYGAVLSLWNFLAERRPDTAKVRVYNPRYHEHGWDCRHTVVEIVNDDMPFIVDSVMAELNAHGRTVHKLVHPVLKVVRDESGHLTELPDQDAPGEAAIPESTMQVQVDEITDTASLQHTEDRIRAVLDDVRAAVADFRPMCQKLDKVTQEVSERPPKTVDSESLEEATAFLRWLEDDNFTFLGYRPIVFEGSGEAARLYRKSGGGMGVLRNDDIVVLEAFRQMERLPQVVRDFIARPDVLFVTKANRRATVHRRVHMDTVGVKSFDAQGQVTGIHLFTGLLTSVAYNRSVQVIPLLRQKFQRVMTRAGFARNSHAGKALVNVLEQYPRDELFQTDVEHLFDTAMGILHLQDRQRIALFVRKDPFERFVSCLAFAPRDRYSHQLRQAFGDILARAYGGTVAAYKAALDDDAALARMHIIIKTEPGNVPEVDVTELEGALREGARSWADRLREALVDSFGEEAGLELTRRYAETMPASFQERFDPRGAVHDIALLEEVRKTGTLRLSMYRPIELGPETVRFKLYHLGRVVPLSETLPTLENMGLRVLGEIPYEIPLADSDAIISVSDFELALRDGAPIDLETSRDNFQEAFTRVWYGDAEDDGFNALILRAGLSWRDVVVLRAYAKFLRQARLPYSQDYMEETLARYPGIAAQLTQLFRVQFDPSLDATTRDQRENALIAQITEDLDGIDQLEEDTIARRFLNAVQASLRTNFFQEDSAGQPKPYLALKINSRQLDDLPEPRPMVESFIYSPRVEATHLRAGKVARGGLRWSDRREDFRTEILGLVKAQMVKNALVVPVGSKGGFFVKRPPAGGDRKAIQQEGIACYRIFMSGLLDITDNLDGDDVVPPPALVRRDQELLGPDPYLVVAADKGTATFSDIANEISQNYGFWIDDAFASGGSTGYDHKQMGITARGAWESVKRHFRELGKDIQTEPFTVAGVGDMAGDVFGNGMLLSEQIQLKAAFNHIHIFLDPDPDPAASYAERKRLFDNALPWTSYDEKVMSKGAAVYERKAKSIKPTPQIKQMLGLTKDQVTPNELLQAILKMEVELLWFGGIGTYIKASWETHAEVGDRGNDGIRVDATELGCQVIGEGANLGLTQGSRIEFARHGGYVNTDAIDNSGGVDCSDHEVNIKILLNKVVANGDMTLKQRNKLLGDMTDEVSRLVLRSNYLQPQAISVDLARGPELLDAHARFMRQQERAGRLKRPLENLPDDETIAERATRREGLTRPELAVLLAYGKMALYDALLESDLPDEPFLESELIRYFPAQLRDTYATWIRGHRLRRELIATQVTNNVINRSGPTLVHLLHAETGIGLADISRAFLVVRNALGFTELWREIEALDNRVPAHVQTSMLIETQRVQERMMSWLLRHTKRPLSVESLTKQYSDGVAKLSQALDSCLTKQARERLEARIAGWREAGVPEELARRVAGLEPAAAAFDLTRIAQGLSENKAVSVADAGRVHWALGERLDLEWLRQTAGALWADNVWQKQAREALLEDLYSLHAELTQRVLSDRKSRESVDAALKRWLKAQGDKLTRIDQLTGELKSLPNVELAMLTVATRQLRGLLAA